MFGKLRNENPEFKHLETICILSGMSIVFGLVFKLHVLFYIALIFLVIGICFKKVSGLISNVWLAFASILGTINSKIILSGIFFIFLTPIAVSYRFLHGDFMEIKRKHTRQTGYKLRNHVYIPADLDNVW